MGRIALLLVLLCAAPASADRASGDWSGHIEGIGNYYWERSTRVIVPSFDARVDAPNGIGFSASYLVDVITSASIAQTGGDADNLFTELRHGVGLVIDKEAEVGDALLKVGIHGTYSTENDYKSLIYGMNGALSLADRNTTLRFGITRTDDDIRSNADRLFRGQLDGLSLGFGVEQTLSPVLLLVAGYDLGILQGWLGNPYRNALVGPLPFQELHPDERWRHSAHVRLAWFLPATDTAIHIIHGAYYDSWEIAALAPELRVYQELGTPDVLLRLRYRFYRQTAAFFQKDAYPAGYCNMRDPCYVTNDPKMTAFVDHTLGIKLDFWLSILEPTFLGFASKGSLFISFDRIWADNAYGNSVIGQIGGKLPF